MKKNFFYSFLLATLIFACNNPVQNKIPKIDTFSTTDMSANERNKLIEGAAHNDMFIVGSWELIAADSSKIPVSKKQLAIIPLKRIDFANDFTFTVSPLPKTIVKGTYEWMAEYREIVFTTKYGTDRMLVKKVDSLALVTKKGDIRLLFKRRIPFTSNYQNKK